MRFQRSQPVSIRSVRSFAASRALSLKGCGGAFVGPRFSAASGLKNRQIQWTKDF
jgi:hypothetical protein